jgi:hypothetical protein
MRKTTTASAILLAAVPTLALAWTPYAPGPGGAYYGYGYPDPYGAPYGMPPMPAGPGYLGDWPPSPFDPAPTQSAPTDTPQEGSASQPPAGAPGWMREGRSLGARPALPRLDVSRRMEGDAYVVDIQVQNIDPDKIEIRPTPRGLVIAYDMSVESNQQDQSPDRRAYRRSYSFSRGTTTRRVALPADAKLDALSREVSENRVILRIPRDTSPSGGYR